MIVLVKIFKKIIDFVGSCAIMVLYLIDTIVKHKTFLLSFKKVIDLIE